MKCLKFFLPIPLHGTSPICHPRVPSQSPKATKNTAYPDLAEICYLSGPSDSSLLGLLHHPSVTPGAPPQSPKSIKNTTKVPRSCLASVFIGKERNNHLKSVNCEVPLICPTRPSPGVVKHPSVIPGAAIRALKQPKIPHIQILLSCCFHG